MPRARPRAAAATAQEEEERCRCEACEERSAPPARADAGAAALSALSAAAIRQERGLPKCLVLLGTGLLEDLEEMQQEQWSDEDDDDEEDDDEGKAAAAAASAPPAASSTPTTERPPGGRRRWPPLPHLDRVAREGMLTPLQLRDLSGLEQSSEAEASPTATTAARQFWGAVAGPPPSSSPSASSQQQQLSDRFKGMRALLLTTSSTSSAAAAADASSVGAEVRSVELGTPERVAEAALGALGMDVLPLGPGEAEMVVLHVDAEQEEEEEEDGPLPPPTATSHRRSLVRWLDHAARAVFQLGGEAARDALLLVVVLTARGLGKGDAAALAPRPAALSGARRWPSAAAAAGDQEEAEDDDPPDISRPMQSGQMLGGAPVTLLTWSGGGEGGEATPVAAALCARRLPGAVRACGAARLALREARRTGEGAVLMERLLPELAYKLGRAAKYGA